MSINTHPKERYQVTNFVDMSPILSTVVQALVKHVHNLCKCRTVARQDSRIGYSGSAWILLILSHFGKVPHFGARRTPWIIRSRCTDFDLNGRISLNQVLPRSHKTLRHLGRMKGQGMVEKTSSLLALMAECV